MHQRECIVSATACVNDTELCAHLSTHRTTCPRIDFARDSNSRVLMGAPYLRVRAVLNRESIITTPVGLHIRTRGDKLPSSNHVSQACAVSPNWFSIMHRPMQFAVLSSSIIFSLSHMILRACYNILVCLYAYDLDSALYAPFFSIAGATVRYGPNLSS